MTLLLSATTKTNNWRRYRKILFIFSLLIGIGIFVLTIGGRMRVNFIDYGYTKDALSKSLVSSISIESWLWAVWLPLPGFFAAILTTKNPYSKLMLLMGMTANIIPLLIITRAYLAIQNGISPTATAINTGIYLLLLPLFFIILIFLTTIITWVIHWFIKSKA